MTRINSAIPVKRLTDEHLLAEHREIKRLPSQALKAMGSGGVSRIPRMFTLGRGHVLFFVDKMDFVRDRYHDIYRECIGRGFHVTYFGGNFEDEAFRINGLCNGYKPTEEEHAMLVGRIRERIESSTKEWWHYCGNRITKKEAVRLLTETLLSLPLHHRNI